MMQSIDRRFLSAVAFAASACLLYYALHGMDGSEYGGADTDSMEGLTPDQRADRVIEQWGGSEEAVKYRGGSRCSVTGGPHVILRSAAILNERKFGGTPKSIIEQNPTCLACGRGVGPLEWDKIEL